MEKVPCNAPYIQVIKLRDTWYTGSVWVHVLVYLFPQLLNFSTSCFAYVMLSRSKKQAAKEAESRREEALLAQLEFAAFGDAPTVKYHSQLSEPELWWSRHYTWLKDNGYILRPRYAPDWTPSWKRTKKSWFVCEDSHVAPVCIILLGLCLVLITKNR